jgi:hypothetical protein
MTRMRRQSMRCPVMPVIPVMPVMLVSAGTPCQWPSALVVTVMRRVNVAPPSADSYTPS